MFIIFKRFGKPSTIFWLSAADNIVDHTNGHTHPPSQTNCEVGRIKISVKDRTQETRGSPQQILTAALFAEAASVNLSKLDHLRTIRSQRKLHTNKFTYY